MTVGPAARSLSAAETVSASMRAFASPNWATFQRSLHFSEVDFGGGRQADRPSA